MKVAPKMVSGLVVKTLISGALSFGSFAALRMTTLFGPLFAARGGTDDADDLQVVFLGELEVAVVVAGHRHDGAGAVLHQHVVGDPDRDRLAGCGIYRVAAGEDAGLLPVAHLPGDQILRHRGLTVRVYLRLLLRSRERVDQRMLRSEDHEGGAEDGVGAGGEDFDL